MQYKIIKRKRKRFDLFFSKEKKKKENPETKNLEELPKSNTTPEMHNVRERLENDMPTKINEVKL